MEPLAPKKQLLITEQNVTEIINRIYVKKSDIPDPRIIDVLRHLCEVGNKKKANPIRMLAIFEARKLILIHASEIYAAQGEDELFDENVDELEMIMGILQEHTYPK